MKRRVNTIKGKRLVLGKDTNIITKDEILVTESPNGIELKERDYQGKIQQISGSAGISPFVREPICYKVNNEIPNSNFSPTQSLLFSIACFYITDAGKSVKVPIAAMLALSGLYPSDMNTIYIYADNNLKDVSSLFGYNTLREYVKEKDIYKQWTEITPDEFLKLYNEAEEV